MFCVGFNIGLFLIGNETCILYLCVFRLWKVIHHDGFSGAAWFDPSALQLLVQQDRAGGAGGREFHCGGLLHGDLQRESPRPAGPQRVQSIKAT